MAWRGFEEERRGHFQNTLGQGCELEQSGRGSRRATAGNIYVPSPLPRILPQRTPLRECACLKRITVIHTRFLILLREYSIHMLWRTLIHNPYFDLVQLRPAVAQSAEIYLPTPQFTRPLDRFQRRPAPPGPGPGPRTFQLHRQYTPRVLLEVLVATRLVARSARTRSSARTRVLALFALGARVGHDELLARISREAHGLAGLFF